MASGRPTADVAEDVRAVREQVAELRALVEQLQQQRIDDQRQVSAYQREILTLRAERPAAVTEHATASGRRTSHVAQTRSRRSSRRALLQLGGAAAAAMALAASEQPRAQAAAATNGDAITAGQTTSATATTTLVRGTGSTAQPLLFVNNANGAGDGVDGFGSDGFAGVSGTVSNSGYGVYGTAGTGGYGVYGSASGGGNGVYGLAGSGGNGVEGYAPGTTGYGVWGRSDIGWGIVGQTGSGVDIVTNGTNRILQHVQSFAGAPTAGTYAKGEQIRDSNSDLWLCVQSGTPGHWVQAAHAVYGYSGGAISYLSKPIRLLDTRAGSTDALTNGGGPYSAGGSPYPVTISGVSFMSVTVPSSCAGAIGNVTVVAGGGGGYLALVPHGAGFSGTANLAYGPSQIVSNAFNVGLSSDGKLDIIIGGNPTDVILDLFAVVA